ncbi:YhcU family protein [Bacillus sp. DTU_2020_1000418_1_SI_GHA_SEK_038]|uniref:YhcU family protein n=1 Tax=Bacillus sp. DTU_2020_1000418_1_SI_GHA_SEK_038 TaxID=3077585 RepID=UPI0028E8A525|nr:YhcU family protein [Bacillus sp. DTU_2020_1000418_1_SI_GHA_SEK_038]WNS76704.1 YhcU family protein [Bacillus sp. DTU_2020_1000418_1_SI_GHA_SEK_038]
MKVVFASTYEQELKIKELIQNLYSKVFPLYFPDEEIKEFERMQVLHTTTRHSEYFGTLKEAYQIIASLQTIISILELPQLEDKYEGVFVKNVHTLEQFGLTFPFSFSQFNGSKIIKDEVLSIYSKAANEILI